METTTEIDLSGDLIAAYRRDGAVLVKGLLSPDEVTLLERGLEEINAGPGELYSRVEGEDGHGETLAGQYPSLGSPLLRQFIMQGPGAKLAARLMETASAQLVLDQVFYKHPGRIVPTPWHQDTPFLQVRGEQMARVWMSCDASPRGVTVQVVRGSHRWNVVYDTATMAKSEVRTSGEGAAFSYDGMAAPGQPPVPDIEAHRDSFDILSWDVEPGDAVVFQGNMLHGAEGRAHHPLPRRALAVMYGGPDLRYHRPAGSAMPLPDARPAPDIPPGAPIGDWPQAFPVIWRAAT
jgi:Phytanoyl-CoA dioxygenase (PhyH)